METNKKSLHIDGAAKDFDAGLTFGAISQELRKVLAPERVVTEIFVDSRAVDLQEEERLNVIAIKDLGDVAIKTRPVQELYRESLQLAPKICDALKGDVLDVVDFFAAKNPAAAQERVGEMTALLEWLLQLISGFEAIAHLKLSSLTYSKGQVMESVDRMQALLTSLHTDLAEQKWDEFQKLLTKEFTVEIDVWKLIFQEVADRSWDVKAKPPIAQ